MSELEPSMLQPKRVIGLARLAQLVGVPAQGLSAHVGAHAPGARLHAVARDRGDVRWPGAERGNELLTDAAERIDEQEVFNRLQGAKRRERVEEAVVFTGAGIEERVGGVVERAAQAGSAASDADARRDLRDELAALRSSGKRDVVVIGFAHRDPGFDDPAPRLRVSRGRLRHRFGHRSRKEEVRKHLAPCPNCHVRRSRSRTPTRIAAPG